MSNNKKEYNLNVDDCLKLYKVDINKGLNSIDIQSKYDKFGYNELPKEEKVSIWDRFKEQFDDLLVKILLSSAVLSFLITIFSGEYKHEGLSSFIEPLVILLILMLNACMGIYQELKAEDALDALKKLQPEYSKCLRDGKWLNEFQCRDLVPGDIIEIRIGDRIPADCRVLELKSTTLKTDQSSLTGESVEVTKFTELIDENDLVISEQNNVIFSSCTVSAGIAICLVIRTGINSEIGKIHKGVMEGANNDKTPLGQKLDEFGKFLAKIIAVICILIWVVNIPNFNDPLHGGYVLGAIYYLKIAVSLGVAAIPEGLPAVITLCLSLGTSRMACRNCIVRKLPSVETLGCTNVICTDKTGTLTTNQMNVTDFIHFSNNTDTLKHYNCDGTDYGTKGEIKNYTSYNKCIDSAIKISSLASDTTLYIDDKTNLPCCQGSPTEGALLSFIEKVKMPDVNYNEQCHTPNFNYIQNKYKRVGALEFTRDRKKMSVLVRDNNKTILYGKGAAEMVVQNSSKILLEDGNIVDLTPKLNKLILNEIENLSKKGLRTISIYEKLELNELSNYENNKHSLHNTLVPENFNNYEQELIWVGVFGLRDPPRKDVKDAINECKLAGIQVFMMTGDNLVTAQHIGLEIGILESINDFKDNSFIGRDFINLPINKQLDILNTNSGKVFARMEPQQKQILVNHLKSLNKIVAMTGDGVNDAPALSSADIGIAMGITGTEVAKQAADMVLSDDNFTSIVNGIEEGRGIYQNTKSFIAYLISSNIGEVISVFISAFFGLPQALIPIQLLWVNLVTDGPPATALGFNPTDPNNMKHKPRGLNDSLITPWVLFRYIVIGSYVGLATVGIFIYWYTYGNTGDNHTLISIYQLKDWTHCPSWSNFTVNNYKNHIFNNPCDYFSKGKETAGSLSLSVLVTIEMLNALSAINERNSIFSNIIFKNPNLIMAIIGSFILHFIILYIPHLNILFQLDPLTFNEWKLVLYFSLPVILIEEILKFITRKLNL